MLGRHARGVAWALRLGKRKRSVLALFDGYTPVYHGVHAPDEVVKWFEEFGLTDIRLGATETSVSGRKAAR